jgi:alkanesulfonate monooxygenase SsuD/methylene tetrahydromethanopterin reductase-like flavin-dependent oxidoreductase (luciferase family)
MQIGIGLPTTVPGAEPDQVLEFARRAEAAGFSTLGTIDRLVYPNYEPLVAFGAVAAVTERIHLMTSVLLLPLRVNSALAAKQAATVQRLSNGRLILGVAVGARPDDFEASGLPMEGRGRRKEEMIEDMQRIWAGEKRGYAGGIGPDVSENPPTLILGGQVDAAFERAARYGAGWIMGGGPPDDFPPAKERLEAAFRAAGREDEPRAMALGYFSLDDDPQAAVRSSIYDYYSFAPYGEMVADSTPKGEAEVKDRVKAFADAGCDELILFPASADPEQADRLAAAVL